MSIILLSVLAVSLLLSKLFVHHPSVSACSIPASVKTLCPSSFCQCLQYPCFCQNSLSIILLSVLAVSLLLSKLFVHHPSVSACSIPAPVKTLCLSSFCQCLQYPCSCQNSLSIILLSVLAVSLLLSKLFVYHPSVSVCTILVPVKTLSIILLSAFALSLFLSKLFFYHPSVGACSIPASVKSLCPSSFCQCLHYPCSCQNSLSIILLSVLTVSLLLKKNPLILTSFCQCLQYSRSCQHFSVSCCSLSDCWSHGPGDGGTASIRTRGAVAPHRSTFLPGVLCFLVLEIGARDNDTGCMLLFFLEPKWLRLLCSMDALLFVITFCCTPCPSVDYFVSGFS